MHMEAADGANGPMAALGHKEQALRAVRRIYSDQRLDRRRAAELLEEIVEEAQARIEAIGAHPGADE